ncbi:MAG: patatin-like phospholipase family protein [Candidatus Cloacimonadota bacterium]|nr:patatin-like phospholipase family protein [Candidatus Cloacimonadota bacterium]
MKKISLLLVILLLTCFLKAEEIGLALSGGGASGLAHIGVLRALEKEGIEIDYISGTSAGALVGGLYAMGYTVDEIEHIVLNNSWREILDDTIGRKSLYISNKRWLPLGNLNFYLDDNYIPKIPQAFFAGNNFINFLFDITYEASATNDFKKFNIPFSCTATNIITGELKVFEQGCLHEVIRASMSFPSLLKPFEIGDSLYIDGGILANLPSEAVIDMGADYVIGVKANNKLKERDDINTLIDVLNQSINVNIQKNVKKSENLCDLLIEPELSEFQLLDFEKAKEIIRAGEKAAERKIKQIKPNTKKRKQKIKYSKVPYEIRITDIKIEGNQYLSTAKTKEYLGLRKDEYYSKSQLINAIRETYNSKLFESIYPRLCRDEKGFILIVKVKEKNRRQLNVSFSYNEDNEFGLSNTLTFTNVLQSNSKLHFNFKVGSTQAVNLDYVKNFGKHYGVYFRIFPNVLEEKFYTYNEDHHKTNSVKSLEWGSTFGVGLYVQRAFILEGYGFYFRKKLYRDIAEFNETSYQSTGLGVKVYHESLDDFDFPMQGSNFMAKLTGAQKNKFSDMGYKKLWINFKTFFPYKDWLSLKFQHEYGSYFENYAMNFDPFFIGGMDSFLGLYKSEKSAPIFQINTFALRTKLYKNLFMDLQGNILSLGNEKSWFPDNEVIFGYGIKLGYKFPLAVLKVGMGIREDNEVQFYLNIGTLTDPFKFSRR